MKTSWIAALSILFLIAAVGPAGGATPKAGAAKKAPAPQTTVVAKKPAAKTVTAWGKITALDAKAMTLTVKGEKINVALIAGAKTAVKEGKEKMAFASLRVGQKVRVTYAVENGKNMATSITVQTYMPRGTAAKTTVHALKKDKPKAPAK